VNVLVDTSVWSLALRRRKPEESPPVRELRELILEGRAQILGPVRQEVLSGIRAREQFQRLRDTLRAFPDLELVSDDFELAAELFNRCRQRGIQGSNTDFLICAVADRLELAILTTDRDFPLFAEHVPVRLHTPRPELRR
jgi:predicted nucleic acid-binding protein